MARVSSYEFISARLGQPELLVFTSVKGNEYVAMTTIGQFMKDDLLPQHLGFTGFRTYIERDDALNAHFHNKVPSEFCRLDVFSKFLRKHRKKLHNPLSYAKMDNYIAYILGEEENPNDDEQDVIDQLLQIESSINEYNKRNAIDRLKNEPEIKRAATWANIGL